MAFAIWALSHKSVKYDNINITRNKRYQFRYSPIFLVYVLQFIMY